MQARLRHFLRVALAACFGRLLASLHLATSLTYFASLFPAFFATDHAIANDTLTS